MPRGKVGIFAYIITLWRYHGHRGRGMTTTDLECGSTTPGAPKCVALFIFYFPSFYTQDSVHQRPCPAANPPNSRCNSQGGKKAATNTQVVSITSIKFDYTHQSAAHPWRGTCLISPIPCLPHYLYHSLIAEFLE